jgi:oligopeptide transport system substrate-binding protein
MKPQVNVDKYRIKGKRISVFIFVQMWIISSVLFFGACNQLEKPKPQPYYSQTAPPPKQEFRWSNGKMPKSFDPALAAAPPETDIIRAVFDGLTDTDAKTLQTIPAVAKEWKSSDDNKTWTFSLRRDAKWSNGETVKAQDFVRSWKRLAEMGEKTAHHELLSNIVGTRISVKEIVPEKDAEKLDVLANTQTAESLQVFPKQSDSNSVAVLKGSETKTPEVEKNTGSLAKTEQKPKTENKTEIKFGAEAVDNFTLEVSLIKPDKDFPSLVAHPIFRPVYGDGKQFETGKLNADIVTNGAFRIFSVGQDGITLDRAEHYWNRKAIEIERVRFVPTENAEKALEAYRAGEIDAVTNADFEPLALKLLTPYDDFRRTTHSALNFYEFNLNRKPFDDSRVREALAIAIERERLTEDDMDGASLPALSFLPFDKAGSTRFAQDTNRAKNLLAEAGFPDGRDFPVIRLLVNRNNIQQRIAKSVAKMWKQSLNIDTEIIVKDSADLEISMQANDFDVLRRGVVLATTNETMNMSMIFASREKVINENNVAEMIDGEENQTNLILENSNSFGIAPEQSNQSETLPDTKLADENAVLENSEKPGKSELVLTEAEALKQFQAIPLYFPTSYSLVKSYVQGFEINTLDAPSLKDVKINSDYKPKTAKGEQ